MKPKEKRMILILVLITIIMFVIMVVVKNSRSNEPKQEEPQTIEEREDGTRKSTSPKLNEIKKLEDLEISNIQISEEKGEATIRANIKNMGQSRKEEFPIKIKVKNKEGEVMQEVGGYVGKLEPGETRSIHASVNMDITDIDDVSFERK